MHERASIVTRFRWEYIVSLKNNRKHPSTVVVTVKFSFHPGLLNRLNRVLLFLLLSFCYELSAPSLFPINVTVCQWSVRLQVHCKWCWVLRHLKDATSASYYINLPFFFTHLQNKNHFLSYSIWKIFPILGITRMNWKDMLSFEVRRPEIVTVTLMMLTRDVQFPYFGGGALGVPKRGKWGFQSLRDCPIVMLATLPQPLSRSFSPCMLNIRSPEHNKRVLHTNAKLMTHCQA